MSLQSLEQDLLQIERDAVGREVQRLREAELLLARVDEGLAAMRIILAEMALNTAPARGNR